jgi:hypothetical protein
MVWICFCGLSAWEVKWNTDMFLETAASSQKCNVIIAGYILKWPEFIIKNVISWNEKHASHWFCSEDPQCLISYLDD